MSEKRVITIVIETEEESPEWIMESNLRSETINGVLVLHIVEGDMIKELNNLEAKLSEAWE